MTLKEQVLQYLLADGWCQLSRGFDYTAAVATKEWSTAVGVKEAVSYLSELKGEHDKGNFFLTAHYESEGRNVLTTQTFTVTPKMTPVEIESGVKLFSCDVDRVISKTYAMKLMLNDEEGPRPR